MMDLIDRFLVSSKLTQLERYKNRYEELVDFSQSERNSIELKIIEEIIRIEQLTFSGEIRSSVTDCLRWKYLTGYYLNRGDKYPYAVTEFLKLTKVLFESSYSSLKDYDHYSRLNSKVIFADQLIRDDFDKSFENINSFVNLLMGYIYTNNKYVYLPFDYLISDSYGVSRPSITESFEVYKERLKSIDNRFIRNPREGLDALEREKSKTWFKSKNKILEIERGIKDYQTYSNLLEDFLNFINKNYDKYTHSFSCIEKLKEEKRKVWILKEVLEVLDALRENTKLKHFLLEKGFDLGLLS